MTTEERIARLKEQLRTNEHQLSNARRSVSLLAGSAAFLKTAIARYQRELDEGAGVANASQTSRP